MVHLVTYDLNKSGQNYDSLYTLLKEYDYIRDTKLDSVWFISTSETAELLTNNILKVIDNNDRLFVTRLIVGQYAGWMHKDIWNWIEERL